MHQQYPQLHACLCFLALPHRDKLKYLGAEQQRQWFEWGQAQIETASPIRVIAMIAGEETSRRFQKPTADEALGGIAASLDLMGVEAAFAVWQAPTRWIEEDHGSLGCMDIWDGLRRLAIIALTDLEWPISPPTIPCESLVEAARVHRESP